MYFCGNKPLCTFWIYLTIFLRLFAFNLWKSLERQIKYLMLKFPLVLKTKQTIQGSSKHWGVLWNYFCDGLRHHLVRIHPSGNAVPSRSSECFGINPLDGRESFKQVKSEQKKNQPLSAEWTPFPQLHLRICLGLGLVYLCLFCGYLKEPYQRVCT